MDYFPARLCQLIFLDDLKGFKPLPLDFSLMGETITEGHYRFEPQFYFLKDLCSLILELYFFLENYLVTFEDSSSTESTHSFKQVVSFMFFYSSSFIVHSIILVKFIEVFFNFVRFLDLFARVFREDSHKIDFSKGLEDKMDDFLIPSLFV